MNELINHLLHHGDATTTTTLEINEENKEFHRIFPGSSDQPVSG